MNTISENILLTVLSAGFKHLSTPSRKYCRALSNIQAPFYHYPSNEFYRLLIYRYFNSENIVLKQKRLAVCIDFCVFVKISRTGTKLVRPAYIEKICNYRILGVRRKIFRADLPIPINLICIFGKHLSFLITSFAGNGLAYSLYIRMLLTISLAIIERTLTH